MKTAVYLFVMAFVTYLTRMLPFALVRKKIKSVYISSVLYYIPYAVISAMAFPALLYSTGNVLTAIFGSLAAFVMSMFKIPLPLIFVGATAVAFAASFIF